MPTIRELRLQANLTPVQLAAALDVALATVYNWETGKYEPRASQLRALARLFNVSMDDIDFDADRADRGKQQPQRTGG